MEVGELVDIYFFDVISGGNHELGLIVDISGYKVEVLRKGVIEIWDKHDLEKMDRWRREMERAHATSENL